MSTWLIVRLLIIAGMAASAFASPLEPQAIPPVGWGAIFAIFAGSSIGLALIIGFQVFNPRSGGWSKPSWDANPFNFRDPLQFFHLVGYAMLASGVVYLSRIGFSSKPMFPEALVSVVMGFGALIAVRLSTVLYKSKLAPNHSLKADGPNGPRP